MHGTTRPRTTLQTPVSGINAVVWIERDRALVVRGGAGVEPVTTETPIPHPPAAALPALAEIAHRVGAVDRVLLLGADELRIALEREIVAIGHRPETIREGVMTGPVDRDALVARLRHLA